MSHTNYYAAVRTHLGKGKKRAANKSALVRKGFRVKTYGDWAYVHSPFASKCGTAKTKTQKLRTTLRKLKLQGSVGLMAKSTRPNARGGRLSKRGARPTRPAGEVRLSKCPRAR